MGLSYVICLYIIIIGRRWRLSLDKAQHTHPQHSLQFIYLHTKMSTAINYTTLDLTKFIMKFLYLMKKIRNCNLGRTELRILIRKIYSSDFICVLLFRLILSMVWLVIWSLAGTMAAIGRDCDAQGSRVWLVKQHYASLPLLSITYHSLNIGTPMVIH